MMDVDTIFFRTMDMKYQGGDICFIWVARSLSSSTEGLA